jgi:hypothetical protein
MQSLINASIKPIVMRFWGYLQNDEKRVNSTHRND